MQLSLSDFVDKETGAIVMTFINDGYFEYIFNMRMNIRKTDIPWKLCVICADEKAFNRCQQYGIDAILLPTEYINPINTNKDISVHSAWNDANWNRITFMKLDAIQYVMSCPEVKYITYIDGDIHIFRDFQTYLHGFIVGDGQYDLLIQSDNPTKDYYEYSGDLCSGFMCFPNIEKSRRLMEYTAEDLAKNRQNADQQHIMAKVAELGLNVKQLDRRLFPNGVFSGDIISVNAGDPYLLHYNFIRGEKKRNMMARNGHWYALEYKHTHMPTNVVYPPFKKGMYLEEYFSKHCKINGNRYIDVCWTNLQIDPKFKILKPKYQEFIHVNYPQPANGPPTKYFTVVQHADGVMLDLPPNTLVFSAGGTGDIPIPLIYEDTSKYLESLPRLPFKKKSIGCSFVGSATHPVRTRMVKELSSKYFVHEVAGKWTNNVSEAKQDNFVEITRKSRFCLAPRGFGKTSFRFYEALQMGCIPVYVWEGEAWLPYKEFIDYSKFSIVIHTDDLGQLQEKLQAITETEYNEMLAEYDKVKYWFSLDGMVEYIHTFFNKTSGESA